MRNPFIPRGELFSQLNKSNRWARPYTRFLVFSSIIRAYCYSSPVRFLLFFYTTLISSFFEHLQTSRHEHGNIKYTFDVTLLPKTAKISTPEVLQTYSTPTVINLTKYNSSISNYPPSRVPASSKANFIHLLGYNWMLRNEASNISPLYKNFGIPYLLSKIPSLFHPNT